MTYEIYLYNIPKVSDDGKQAIPVPGSQVKELAGDDDAREFAAQHKNKYDRVVLIQKDDDGQKMIERYVNE
jgi:hypothetical protein